MALNLDSLGLSAKVTAEGISAPDYQTILSTLISYFQQIYGSDAYLEPDSKDGQMVALMALAIHGVEFYSNMIYELLHDIIVYRFSSSPCIFSIISSVSARSFCSALVGFLSLS